ncbi:DEAD/DEAH box helicase family protein [Vibrio sp. SM6]|uniref:DEAD/DEAH box helicase family protein n=1 Tax=Vibrio agarilyticus TaxID=2726741 RepID=A0A7X8TSP7_9VIBR|nr:DEAD/DEAH box helicase family protein [Vibrio agarilyticus]NLS13936.1 DEAD/DEAH box helicase family protein [Vibrio agarilyticus]
MLRVWQQECATAAVNKYLSGERHFFCQATPGAGKTVLAATIASRLLELNFVDLVLCFSPSRTIADGMKTTFSTILGRPLSGALGSVGQSMTYQSLQFINDEFLLELSRYRVFAVFDEIHHCAGSEIGDGNVWGKQVLAKIQKVASYTLALSGTPWRSDALPIVMANYTNEPGTLRVDYQYTLKQAVIDNVCRSPKIVLVDSNQLSVVGKESSQSFTSIAEMLKRTDNSYQHVIHNQEAMIHLLKLACEKLNHLRIHNPDAAGLVVATSVEHALQIEQLLISEFGQSTIIVTYKHEQPLAEIERFRSSNQQWIVSVGMISEGTDIPRLQVCCHLSAIKTELYFRQVLGRVLRANGTTPQEAWLFTFAEQNLVEFAERLEQDIPDSCVMVKLEKNCDTEDFQVLRNWICGNAIGENDPTGIVDWRVGSSDLVSKQAGKHSDELSLQAFKQRVISAFG